MFEHLPIETDRLLLRQWRADDHDAFAALNADPEVMAYFPGTLDREASDELAHRATRGIAQDGYSFFAVEVKDGVPFIGMIGLNVPSYGAWLPCGPCLEIGWRLAKDAWGKGYASEGARACLGIAFQVLNVTEVYSFATAANARSRTVMQRIGLERVPHADFDHIRIPPEHPLTRHVLYRIDRETWAARNL